MGLFRNGMPYVNFHELNLDYILKRVKAVEDYVYNTIDTIVSDKADEFFKQFAVKALYKEDTQTIKLEEVQPNE